MNENYGKTGETVKIHSNRDGVRVTAIMLTSSIAASTPWRYPVMAMKQTLEITSAALRENN